MPGIVGIITKRPSAEAMAQLQKMTDVLCHESFYVASILSDSLPGVAVASVAHANSPAAHMPVHSARQDVALMFAGEEFGDPYLESDGETSGRSSETSLSRLIDMYERDQNFPAGLNGRFQGLIVDKRRQCAILFNDRFGMHRLYYYESADAFYFACEAKAILAICPALRSLDTRSLGEFLSCGAVLENRTLFKGIQALPPASAWLFQNSRIQRKKIYFEPTDWEQQDPLDPNAYINELEATFDRCLPRYFRGNQKIGMSLTGGLDTRMILACHMPVPGSLPCYTFGSMFRENQDVRLAASIAQLCQQSHQVITPGTEFLAKFGEYAERTVYLTDGCVDVSRTPDLYLNARVREIAPVRMTGNYGGEVLRGVQSFKPEYPTEALFCHELMDSIRNAGHTFERHFNGHPVSNAAFKQAPWYLQNILILEQTQLSMRSPFLDNDFIRTVYRAPTSTLRSNEISLRLIRDGNSELLRLPTDRGVAGERNALSRAIHRIGLEFLFKAEYGYDMGMPQWLAKVDHMLAPLRIERLFLGRHKVFHFRVWYRDYLADYLKEMLLDSRCLSRPYIEKKELERIVYGHVGGAKNYTEEIHKVLTLELIHRLFLDRPSEAGGMRQTHPNLQMDHWATA